MVSAVAAASPAVVGRLLAQLQRRQQPQLLRIGSHSTPLERLAPSHDLGNSSWAHGQSTWQREHSSSTWQFERSQSSWQQHLSDWKNGENWHNGNWHNGNWNNNWWGHNGSWASSNWWGHNNWWGHSNWWNHSGFCYYPAIGIGAAFSFPWWCDTYYPAYDYYSSYDYVTPYYLSSALYSPASAVISQPEVSAGAVRRSADDGTAGGRKRRRGGLFRSGLGRVPQRPI